MSADRFAGQVVAVTGGNSGIGAETVLRFAAEGARVVVIARNVERSQEVVAQVIAAGGHAMAIAADMRNPAGCTAAIEGAIAAHGRLDVLVNNAGIAVPYPFMDTPIELWQELLDTNLTGSFVCAQAAARQMAKQNYGRIINVSSQVALMGNTERAAYSASKGALLSLTRAMAVELAQYGITCNVIAPGAVATPMTEANHSAERRALWMDAIPLRRYGRPQDMAGAILFLASKDADYITGQTLAIDGGFSIKGLMMKTAQKGPATPEQKGEKT
jgi:3-oxoacyl-[acyl-carrier protein] reductase